MGLLYRFVTLGQNVFSVDFKFSNNDNPDAVDYIFNSVLNSAGRINVVPIEKSENIVDFDLCELLEVFGLEEEQRSEFLDLYEKAKKLSQQNQLKLLKPIFDQQREILSGIYIIWIGSTKFCNGPISFGGQGRLNTVVRAIQAGTGEVVRGELCTEPLMKEFIINDDRDYFSKWLEENCDVNLGRIRERLGFRDPPTPEQVKKREEVKYLEAVRIENLRLEEERKRERQREREDKRRKEQAEKKRLAEEQEKAALLEREKCRAERLEREALLKREADRIRQEREAFHRIEIERRKQLEEEEKYRRQIQIQQECKRRGIEHLVHFTRFENIINILKCGIVPRDKLKDGHYTFNDDFRLDRRPQASCLSISFPNYRMFYRYQKQNPDTEWCVLLISPEILWKLDCAFTYENAASSTIANTPLSDLKSYDAFLSLFSNQQLRSSLNLPSEYTTNPQAEVLVFDIIPTEYIKAIKLKNYQQQSHLRTSNGYVVPVQQDPSLFTYRRDYMHWQSKKDSENG